jgi:ribosomal protein L37AE/L43A
LVDGVVTELRIPGIGEGGAGGNVLATRTAGKFYIGDQAVSIRSHRSLSLPVFVCPYCSTDRYRLHLIGGVWACRDCQKRRHRVDYASKHTQYSVPGWHRIGWLRRRIGADPRPFKPLPAMSLRHHRYWRLAREIRAVEARLLQHGENIADVLENRHGGS